MESEAREALQVAFDPTKPIADRLLAAHRAADRAGTEAVVPLGVLLTYLPSESKPAVVDLLAKLHALEVLSPDLKSSDAQVRQRSALLLGHLGDADATPILVDALSDPDHKVRESAASALRRLKDPRALSKLVDLVAADPHPDVRGACAQALGELDDPQALEALECATRKEADLFTIILIEKAILQIMDRAEHKAQEEGPIADHVRLPSVYGVRVPLSRRTSSVMTVSR